MVANCCISAILFSADVFAAAAAGAGGETAAAPCMASQ